MDTEKAVHASALSLAENVPLGQAMHDESWLVVPATSSCPFPQLEIENDRQPDLSFDAENVPEQAMHDESWVADLMRECGPRNGAPDGRPRAVGKQSQLLSHYYHCCLYNPYTNVRALHL